MEAPQVKIKEEKIDSWETEPSVMPSSGLDTISSPHHGAESGSLPFSSLPLSVVIKEEPQSPVHVSSEQDTVNFMTLCAHSTTPELPGDITHCKMDQSSPSVKLEPSQTNCVEPAECKDKFPAQVEMTETSVEALRNCSSSLPDATGFVKPFSRKAAEVGSIVDCADNQSVSSPTLFNTLAAPLEMRNEKRVRKLKKRKVLKKAQEQPESSDSEMVEEPTRPRWLQQRRRPSGGSQVSTSSQPTDDREMNTDDNNKMLSLPLTSMNLKEDHTPPEKITELQASLTDPAANADLMEVTACQQHQMDDLLPPPPSGLTPDSCRPGPQSLACNEVSSTSDMDLCKSER